MFRSVLLVCTGNICRSPYAEAVFKKHLGSIDVGSAGLAALVGHDADSTASSVAWARGIDLSLHRGKQISRALVGQSDLILVMDEDHLQRLHKRYPEARGKSFKLAKLVGDKNIVDPHLKSQSFFELVFDQIDAAAAAWVPHFK